MVTSLWRVAVVGLLTWIAIELHGIHLQTSFVPPVIARVGAALKGQCNRPSEPQESPCQPNWISPVAAPQGRSFLRALEPASNASGGSVGNGAQHSFANRSGGAPQYGNSLFEYLVTAPIADGQFDVGASFWSTATQLSGGSASLFGAWIGANTPGRAESFGGGAAVGLEINVGNRFGDFGPQTDVGGTRYTVGLQLVPDLLPTSDTISYRVTMNSGNPGTVSWAGHQLPANTPVVFGGTGTLPAALSAGKTYFVLAAGLSPNAFRVSSVIGGNAVDFESPSSGAVNAIPSFPGSFAQATGPSLHAHKWWVGSLLRYDSIMPGGHGHYDAGGSASTFNNPRAWTAVTGYWVNGLDLSTAVFSGAPLVFSIGQTAVSASDGGTNIALPAHVYKYVKANIGGQNVLWPVYLP